MKLPFKELVVASRLEKYPPPPAGDNASLKRWRSFSPFWWGIVQGLIEGLLQNILWQDLTDDIRRQIEALALPENPDCEECEECEDCPTPQTSGGGGGELVGLTGLTYSELEEFYLMFSLRNQLAWVNGVLCYWSEGCCDWVKIEAAEGQVPTIPLGAETRDPTSTTIEQWDAAGQPGLQAIAVGAHSIAEYITDDSIKCAKATALTYKLKAGLSNLWSAFLGASAGGGILTGALTGAIVAAFSWPIALAVLLAVAVVAAVGVVGFESVSSRLEEFADDEDTWLAMICDMVSEMSAGTTITATDINVLLYWFRDKWEIGVDDWEYKVVKAFPVSFFHIEAAADVVDQECDCDQYLPSGYIPPVVGDAYFVWYEDPLFGGGATVDLTPNLNGQIFTYPQTLTPDVGQILTPASVKTTFAGVAASKNISKFSCIIENVSGAFDLSGVKLNVAVTGTPDALTITGYAYDEDSDTWVTITGYDSSISGLLTEVNLIPASTITNVTHIAIVTRIRGATFGAVLHWTMSNVRITGVAAGVPFEDLPMNTAM